MTDERRILSTYSGRRLDLDDPQPNQIGLEDIASALSKICRFGARARQFYSVAQHAVLVQSLVLEQGREDLALEALHHDSHEAYVCDVPTPVKDKLGMAHPTSLYKNLCNSLDIAISRKLGYRWLDKHEDAVLKRADHHAILAEASVLLHDQGKAIRKALKAKGVGLDEFNLLPEILPLPPEDAARAFMEAHATYAESEIRSDA